jgi:hypothetical protein
MNRGTDIRTDLAPGDHVLKCELLDKPADPGGGTEFRIISVMRYVPSVPSLLSVLLLHLPHLSSPYLPDTLPLL